MSSAETRWEIIQGTTHLLLVAPHNFPHMREGAIKLKDGGTGSMVKKLCAETGTWGMISTAIQEDPNWYVDSAFRKELKDIVEKEKIEAVVDIHGRRPSWPTPIDAYLNASFEKKFGTGVVRDFTLQHFLDNGQITIVEDLDTAQVPAVEVEIRQEERIEGNEAYEDAMRKLKQLINAITE